MKKSIENIVTVESLRQLLKDRYEKSEPQDTILKFFQQNEGKRVDKRFIKKLREYVGDETIDTRHVVGMISIVWRGDDTGLLFTYGPAVANSADLLKYNGRYYFAKDARNAEREELSKDTKRLAKIATAINAYNAALALLDVEFGGNPKEHIYQSIGNPDHYAMMKLAPGYVTPLNRKTVV